jgi:hypothetical protein
MSLPNGMKYQQDQKTSAGVRIKSKTGMFIAISVKESK